MTDNKSFCSLLWMHAAVKTTGEHRACCLMSNHKNQGFARKPDGTIYNWGTDSILEAHNSQQIREMRLKMLQGQEVPECTTCYTKENNGYPSRRLSSNSKFRKFNIDQAKSVTDGEGYTTQRPKFLDLRFGNLCNLKCVMCHSNSSSQWYDDHIKLYGEDEWAKNNLNFNGKKWVDKGQMDWWKSESFWNQIENLREDLRDLQMVGGEPLMIEKHYDFLQQLVDTGDSKNIRLEYDTNLTYLQPRVVDLWKNFKRINVRVSIDDFGDRFRYIRYPGNYDKVIENLEILKSEVKGAVIQVAITWQVLGAFGLLELLDDLGQRNMTDNLNIRILDTPEYYNCSILPEKTKKDIIQMYKNSMHYDKISHLIKYLENNPDEDEKEMQNFYKIQDKLDLIRNQDWRKTFPKLWASLNE